MIIRNRNRKAIEIMLAKANGNRKSRCVRTLEDLNRVLEYITEYLTTLGFDLEDAVGHPILYTPGVRQRRKNNIKSTYLIIERAKKEWDLVFAFKDSAPISKAPFDDLIIYDLFRIVKIGYPVGKEKILRNREIALDKYKNWVKQNQDLFKPSGGINWFEKMFPKGGGGI